jgi:hypothetical protein
MRTSYGFEGQAAAQSFIFPAHILAADTDVEALNARQAQHLKN